MSREYALNGSNKKSPISGGRRAPLKLTYSETHRIGEKSRSFDSVTVEGDGGKLAHVAS